MNQLITQFGTIVREARESKGWSQEVLAEKANLNRSYVGEVERGSVMPSLGTIAKISQALDVNISSLIARCEQPLGLHSER